jgi:hypothetical protein
MVVILISWIYIAWCCVNLGVALGKMLQLKVTDFALVTIIGLFTATLLGSFWAFFGGIGLYFHLPFLLLNGLLFGCYYHSIKNVYSQLVIEFKQLSVTLKILFGAITFLILAQCASFPFIIDNESYYVQTIKWLNEYGFVKGLSNLHLFFGQTSGWHIAQSVFNFSFIYNRFNDLNGLLLVLFHLFCFRKLHLYFQHRQQLDLVFGLLPIANVFFFQFVSSPSPDLAVYLLSLLLFSLWIDHYKTMTVETFKLVLIISLFLIYIKITAVVVLIFPFVLVFTHFSTVKPALKTASILSLLVLGLFVSKNIILTGYPLFPLAILSFSLDYALPKEVMTYFFGTAMQNKFYIQEVFEDIYILNKLKHYFLFNGIDGMLNFTTLLTVIFSPIIIYRKYHKTSVWVLYGVFLLLIVLLLSNSLQYRFYIHFTIFFLIVGLSLFLVTKKSIYIGLSTSCILTAILVFIPLSFGGLTANTLLGTNSTFGIKNFIYPNPNSKWNLKFVTETKGNLHYNSPKKTDFFLATGNGALPCVNKEQLDYFETNFYYVPQMRTHKLEDGFYPKKIKHNE